MRRGSPAILAFTLVLSACAGTAADRSTPAKSLAVMIDAAQAEDYATVRATYHATSKPAMAAADDLAAMSVSLHRYHRVMTKYFPDQKPLIDDQNIDQRLTEMRTQLAKITFTIQGHHATASEPFLGTDFVFDGHIWKIDVDRMENVENYLNDKAGTGMAMGRFTAHLARAADTVAIDVESGKIKTYEEAAKVLNERMSKAEREFHGMGAAATASASAPATVAAHDRSTPQKMFTTLIDAIDGGIRIRQ